MKVTGIEHELAQPPQLKLEEVLNVATVIGTAEATPMDNTALANRVLGFIDHLILKKPSAVLQLSHTGDLTVYWWPPLGEHKQTEKRKERIDTVAAMMRLTCRASF